MTREGPVLANETLYVPHLLIVSLFSGDGDYCEDGLKFYCCEIPDEKKFNCQWSGEILSHQKVCLSDISGVGCGEDCGSNQKSLTYDNGDYECLDGSERQFCCDKDEEWENCAWHGKDGSCFVRSSPP